MTQIATLFSERVKKKYMWIMDLCCNQQFHVILEYSINFLAQNYLSIFFPIVVIELYGRSKKKIDKS